MTTTSSEEHAKRFLRYFHDLIKNPEAATLDIQALPDDWRVLSRLAQGFCFLACELDNAVGKRWTRRKLICHDELLRALPLIIEAAEGFLYEHIWVETRSYVCAIRKEVDGGTLSTLDNDIQQVTQFLANARYLLKRAAVVDRARKPRADHDANFYLYLMAEFLKLRGATIETAIYQEIADYVNAHFEAASSAHTPLLRDDVKRRINRFEKSNKTLALRMKGSVLAYVRRETGIVPITKPS